MLNHQNYVTGEYYHVFNKNIDGLKVFSKTPEKSRFFDLIRYYQLKDTPCPLSQLITYTHKHQTSIEEYMNYPDKDNLKIVDIIAYCIMPTHFHLLLHQLEDNGISSFISNVLNGFTRYYNLKHERKGPIWIGRSKNVYITSDEHLWEESRYIHRNPYKAGLVRQPSNWLYSSYAEYLGSPKSLKTICNKSLILESIGGNYRNFVEEDLNSTS